MKKLFLITFILLLLSGCGQKSYEYYRDLALQLNIEGSYEEAIEASDKCIEIKDNIDCWTHKANANYHLDNCTKALADIYHAVMLDPNNEGTDALMVMLLRDPKCPELIKMIENKQEEDI